MIGSSARKAWIVVLPLLLTGCAGGDAHGAGGEPIVGGPCEGCEAVFVGMPEAIPSHARIAPPDEPGEALRIEGRVLWPDGRPAPGVIVYAYQTNADGIYPRDRRLRGAAARHGALRGWARADDKGRYGFDTVRPGGYPDSDMPQHVHMHVIEPGRCTYYIDDIVFRDDPRLTDEKLASYSRGRGGSGVVMPQPSGPSAWIATRDIVLGEKIPGYPPLGPMDTSPAREVVAPARAIDPSSLDNTFLSTEPKPLPMATGSHSARTATATRRSTSCGGTALGFTTRAATPAASTTAAGRPTARGSSSPRTASGNGTPYTPRVRTA